jgi:ATP synthase protein I
MLSAILLGWYWPSGWTAAYSALIGGMIATLANAWFAYKIFGTKPTDQPEVVVRNFYWGELNKILFTCAMFVAAFVLIRPVNAAALLAAYFIVHMTPAAVDVISRRK